MRAGLHQGAAVALRQPRVPGLGDEYWRPDIIATTWDQAETGRIPVSGAGYRGPFAGPGFDSMWTDMSEIVRPTRDGIHGREYISTSVDVGPKPMRLTFTGEGELACEARCIDLPIPVILAERHGERRRDAMARAVRARRRRWARSPWRGTGDLAGATAERAALRRAALRGRRPCEPPRVRCARCA